MGRLSVFGFVCPSVRAITVVDVAYVTFIRLHSRLKWHSKVRLALTDVMLIQNYKNKKLYVWIPLPLNKLVAKRTIKIRCVRHFS
jgi:hypothetical protein